MEDTAKTFGDLNDKHGVVHLQERTTAFPIPIEPSDDVSLLANNKEEDQQTEFGTTGHH